MAESFTQIVVDVGNGRVKAGLCLGTSILERRETATPDLDRGRVEEFFRGWAEVPVTLCSVVPQAVPPFAECLGDRLNVLTHHTDLGIGIRYPNPETIGPDRLANAVALAGCYGAPGIGIDFGTAVTFDIVSADRHYQGGIIAPGLRLMTDYLHERTALLPKVDLAEPETAIGQSTEGAILAGAALGYRGMIRGLLDAVGKELGAADPVVVATGGDAEWIVRGMQGGEGIQVDPDLTLHGLRLVGDRLHGES